MKSTKFIYAILTCLFFVQCKSYYTASDFESKTNDHITVAILPFQMVYTGRQPDDLSPEDIQEIEKAESQAFQISYFNQILKSTRSGRKQIRIQLQDYQKTLRILSENNIDILSSWDKSASELASILDVDAVVRARIQKHRYMSDLESYGISVGIHIIDIIAGTTLWPWIPLNVARAKDIQADYRLMDKDDDELLWSISFEINADWSQKSNEIIDQINRRAASKFPYRTK